MISQCPGTHDRPDYWKKCQTKFNPNYLTSEPDSRDCSMWHQVLLQSAEREEKGAEQGQMGPQENSFTSETHSISSPSLANANSNTWEELAMLFIFC